MSEPRRDSFLFLNVAYVVQSVFLASVLVNGWLLLRFLSQGRPFMATWALIAAFQMPRSVLAILLVAGRRQAVFLNLSQFLFKFYPITVRRYRSDSLLLALYPRRAYLKPALWLAAALVPLFVALG